MRKLAACGLLIFSLSSCGGAASEQSSRTLPIYGNFTVETSPEGKTDTIYHTVGPFEFYDQDSVRVTEESTRGKVYVADFFFTSCQEICIPMAGQMLRVNQAYGSHPDFMILSHSIDPDFDTVAVLKQYANKLNLPDSTSWRFLTGGTTDVYRLGEERYMVTAHQDERAPGGLLHSGHFLLVDGQGRIRGVYDGTDQNAVDQLIADIDLLL